MRPEQNIQKKKILFLIQLPPPLHGVSEMNRLITSNNLLFENFDLEVVELKFSDSFSGIRRLNFNKVYKFFKVYFHLIIKLRNFSPDLIYFSFMPVGIGFFRDFIYLCLLKRYNNKIVLHLHNKGINDRASNKLYSLFYKSAFKNLTIIHVSECLMIEEFSQLSVKNCSHYILPNTCEPFHLQKTNKNIEQINILFLSNLFPEKGIEIAIEAFTSVLQKHPDIILHIYGHFLRDKYQQKIRNSISNNTNSDKIILHGPANEITKQYAFSISDIFIFPSYFNEECMPLSLLEAMQAELPIIASKIGAIPEIIEDKINGLLTDPWDVNELTDKINFLIENETFRTQIGMAAGITYQEKYSYESFKKKFMVIINDVLQNKE